MFSFTAPRMDDQQVKDERQNMCEEERMAIYRDLYGKEEDETFLTEQEEDTLLEKLQEELDAIKVKDAYDLATEKCSDIVLDRSFRLQFLAADKFDPKLAATRMANYWTYKKEIFGTGELFAKKSIEISDLSEKEKKALSQSIFFKLPGTDKHGRLILFSTRQGWVFEKPKEMRRAMWYTMQTISEDPTCTSKGVVGIAFDVGSYEMVNHNRKANSGAVRLVKAVPHLRNRVVDHSSRSIHWIEEFENYGFSKEDLPEAMCGSLKFDYADWVKKREEEERKEKGL